MYHLEVFHSGIRIIKMVKKLSPTLIFGRLPKADRMIFESIPMDKKQVFIWIFNASLQLMRNISLH